MASDWHHIPVHSPSFDADLYEDPFEKNVDLTFPPLRYMPLFYDRPLSTILTAPKTKRRESSKERERLYRELVGHEPYHSVVKKRESGVSSNCNGFSVKLDVKHYKPDEITLKVDGKYDFFLMCSFILHYEA